MTDKQKAAEQHLNEHGVYPEDFISSSSYFGAVKAVATLKESTPSDHIADAGKMAGKTVFKINPQYIHINGEDHWIDTIVCHSPTSTPSTEQESQEAKIARLESLLEAETSRAEGWRKQYYEIKQKLDLHIAITGNEYTLKPKKP